MQVSDTSSAATTGNIVSPCPHCGMVGHVGKCPLVSAIEYFPDGRVKRVEYHGPAPVYAPPAFPFNFGPWSPSYIVTSNKMVAT